MVYSHFRYSQKDIHPQFQNSFLYCSHQCIVVWRNREQDIMEQVFVVCKCTPVAHSTSATVSPGIFTDSKRLFGSRWSAVRVTFHVKITSRDTMSVRLTNQLKISQTTSELLHVKHFQNSSLSIYKFGPLSISLLLTKIKLKKQFSGDPDHLTFIFHQQQVILNNQTRLNFLVLWFRIT